jgi:hypothetical protein
MPVAESGDFLPKTHLITGVKPASADNGRAWLRWVMRAKRQFDQAASITEEDIEELRRFRRDRQQTPLLMSVHHLRAFLFKL